MFQSREGHGIIQECAKFAKFLIDKKINLMSLSNYLISKPIKAFQKLFCLIFGSNTKNISIYMQKLEFPTSIAKSENAKVPP